MALPMIEQGGGVRATIAGWWVSRGNRGQEGKLSEWRVLPGDGAQPPRVLCPSTQPVPSRIARVVCSG